MSRVFHTSISSASYLEYDTSSNQIVFQTRMFNPKTTSQEMREVTIDEEEWRAIIKYGEQAGFFQS